MTASNGRSPPPPPPPTPTPPPPPHPSLVFAPQFSSLHLLLLILLTSYTVCIYIFYVLYVQALFVPRLVIIHTVI